jgi:hypothetical protein
VRIVKQLWITSHDAEKCAAVFGYIMRRNRDLA